MTSPVWAEPRVVEWSRWLLDSYHRWTGCELIEGIVDPARLSRALFETSVIVVSHGIEPDPILNYGNRAALELWDTTWEQLVRMPSRLTAEPVEHAERERMLEAARSKGFFDGYRGVRISSTGRRFLVENAIIWTVLNRSGVIVGQAATFSQWRWL